MTGVVTEPTALVGGRAALILATVLAGGVRGVPPLERLLRDMRLDPVSETAALEALRALEEAGHAWRASRLGGPLPQAGNPATAGNGDGVASEVMDAQEVARMLGRSPRRVRQLAAAGELPATPTSRGWRFLRAEVVGYRDAAMGGD